MTQPAFFYNGFGLNFSSDIEFAGFPPAKGEADVRITVGALPETAGDTEADQSSWQVVGDTIICRKRSYGGYAVRGGQEITFAPGYMEFIAQSNLTDLVLETLFTYIWLQRGAICLHASSVNINGRAVVFTGNGGSGKSTTSAALAQRGYDKLSDDICVIFTGGDGVPKVVPTCRIHALTGETLSMLGVEPDMSKKMPGEDKYTLPYRTGFSDQVPLAEIYHLSPDDTDDLQFVKLSGFDKLKVLVENGKHTHLVPRMNPSTSQMERFTRLGNSVSMTRIVRPLQRQCLTELAESIVSIR